ncbi:type I-E CRISPR-associated protein Cse2/CasB [Gilvimarinus agarilyticus]|uniref:type I-E CRISPR-associated protein Cse2/CasB n=1 Tax=Gilvimarinus sp. 2_MG-2023 TaxID=3062666 RepID=UPI001C0A15C3|nr:type I-E CRISPR-associated protein Cse2/CasB [Gilvimarinus sp. 2_MG-2023]MBU2885471.1 type I-E CRISPR-associated protein Cse2/CasB [Gilvimarinus agarilyticus]MDO6570371.1 type I-E CRISPR-associated protein Cse2/CasB [Gilvimarinus sp. 2_MG-2023]
MSTEAAQLQDSVKKQGLFTRWWHRLVNSDVCQRNKLQALPTAHKAILKRCNNLDEVMLSEPFQVLWQFMPEEKRSPPYMEVAALIAWVLASVRKDSDAGLAKAMACKAGEGSDRPRVSTLRFQQLIKSRDTAEFARRLRRILHQIDDTVSVQSLAQEVERWYWQSRSAMPEVNPAKRQVLRWAMDYYAAAPKTS